MRVIAVAQGSGERLCNSEMTVAACMKTSERVQTRWVATRSVKGGGAIKDNMHSGRVLTSWKHVDS